MHLQVIARSEDRATAASCIPPSRGAQTLSERHTQSPGPLPEGALLSPRRRQDTGPCCWSCFIHDLGTRISAVSAGPMLSQRLLNFSIAAPAVGAAPLGNMASMFVELLCPVLCLGRAPVCIHKGTYRAFSTKGSRVRFTCNFSSSSGLAFPRMLQGCSGFQGFSGLFQKVPHNPQLLQFPTQ